MSVTGSQELDSQLERLTARVPRITHRAVVEASNHAADQIASHISNASVRGTIAARMVRSSGYTVAAKVGAGVGRGSAFTSKTRSGRSGVGIDGRNVHWWFLGTSTRTTGTKRSALGRADTGGLKRFTGRMPPQDKPISVLLDYGRANHVLRTWIHVGIKEAGITE